MKITYIVLAQSVPEYSKKNGCVFTCTIGYSPQLDQLIRVYPMPLQGMERWGKYEIDVEKNKLDSRIESWKLSSYARKENWIGVDKDVHFVGKVDRNKMLPILVRFSKPNIKYLNEQKKSIGIIPIDEYRVYWDDNTRSANRFQLSLFEDVEMAEYTKYTKDTMNYEPRISFKANDGEHDLSYNDWGVCMWYKKFAGQYPMDDAFRFLKNKRFALLGNLNFYRNSWLCFDLY